MKRAARRVVSVAIVGASAIAAAAFGGAHIVGIPPVVDVHPQLGMVLAKNFTLMNDGDMIANIQSFMQDVGVCTNIMMQGSGAPQMIAPGASGPAAINCPPINEYTIDRCHFFVKDTMARTIGSFTGLCIVEGQFNLDPLGPLAVNFPDTPVGGTSAPQTVMMTNNGSAFPITKLSVQIADQDGNFEVASPCTNAGPGCKDQIVSIAGGAPVSVDFLCTPKSAGAHTAKAWVVGDNATKLVQPYVLTCNGTTGGGGPVITSDRSMVMLAAKVIGPAGTSAIHVSNAGTADLHISMMQLSGSTEWTFAATAPCTGGSCTLTPGGAGTDITFTFTPTDFGPMRNAQLAISSDDPNTAMLQIPLNGTGLGATLAMGTSLGMPPTLPIAGPVNQTTPASFNLTNNGNDALGQVTVMLTTTPGITLMAAPMMIASGALAPVTIACHPTSATTVHATLTISSPEALHGTSPLPPIDVSCTGTMGTLVAKPNPVLFGEVRTNEGMVMKPVTLTSMPSSVMVTDPVLVMNVPGMSVTGVTSPMTPSGFSVLFTPMSDGPVSNTAMVTASDSSNVPVGITGQVTTADLEVPDTAQAGAFCVGGATTPTAVALRSTGTASIHLLQPVLAGGATSPFQLDDTVPTGYPYQLPAQQNAMIAITPRRQSHAGMQMDTIQWTTDMPGKEGPQTVVSASFVETGGAIAPQAVDFGSLPLNQPATDQIVTLRNCGSDAMDLSPAVIAPPSGDFHDTSTMPLPMTLAPNQTATVSVGFKPRHSGLSTGTLTIATSTGELGVTLTGRGIGLDQGPRTSFYACGCQSRSADPSGLAPIVIVFGILRRRRK